MSIGKSCSQSGHAALGAFLNASIDRQKEYMKDGIGTKICLECPNLDALIRAYQESIDRRIPAVFIEDSGRNTCFNGVTTATAVGIGPVTHKEVPFLRKFQLHK
jgi:peptidyl-tRNA hydrolase